MKKIIVNENIAYQRLDRFLRKYLGKEFALSFIYKMLRNKRITVNKKKTQPKYLLAINDIIELHINDQDISFLQKKQKNKLQSVSTKGQTFLSTEIIYEDQYLLVINKKAGQDLQTDLLAKLRGYLRITKNDQFSFHPAFVHRLDKGTSGLLIAAKTNLALKKMAKLFRERKIAKYYKALLSQKIKPQVGIIKLQLQKTTINGLDNQVVVSKCLTQGKETITHFKKIKDYGKFSLVNIILKTGFKHQIRVHFGHRGWGLVGDNKYGDKKINSYFYNKFKLKHQLLQAYRLVFVHPFTEQKLDLGIALPTEWSEILDDLKTRSR